MKRNFLIAGLLAVSLAALTLVGFDLYAIHVEDRYVHVLAPEQFDLKNVGTALQDSAFRQSDLLPIYGSSELNIHEPYHASDFFAQYPTGFTIFPVGKAGTTDLIILEDLAAAGGDLQGKKVVISLSAPWFFHGAQGADSYAGNFSREHAVGLAFSSQLSFAVKHDAAVRMLQYPDTLKKDPLLRFGLEQLARNNEALYYAAWPLGKLDGLVLQLQDHWETLQYIRKQKKLDPIVVKKPAPEPNWNQLTGQADREQKQNADNNPFGFQNNTWAKFKESAPKQPAKSFHDAQFVANMEESTEWSDLALLLRSLREMGAQPLVLSMPIQGTYYDWTGVSKDARHIYYDKLNRVVKPFKAPVLNFADHDEDKYFIIDPGAHLSREGWVYYDKALDQFYHGTLH